MKRSHALIAGCLLLLLTAVAAAAGWSFNQAPRFYRDALVQPADHAQRQQQAKHLESRTMRFVEEIYHADAWSQEFTDVQINSWLAEELPRHRGEWLPPGVYQPRVQFTEGTIHLAFRYIDDCWDTVVSVQLKPQIACRNCLAVEFVGAHAGGIPLPMDNVLSEISRTLTAAGWLHVWTERDGHRVILLDLDQAGLAQPVLESLEVRAGVFQVSGRRLPAGDGQIAELFLRPSVRDALLRR